MRIGRNNVFASKFATRHSGELKMSKIRFRFAFVSAAVLCGLTSVQAQQTTPAQPRTVLPATAQPSQRETAPNREENNQGERNESIRALTDASE